MLLRYKSKITYVFTGVVTLLLAIVKTNSVKLSQINSLSYYLSAFSRISSQYIVIFHVVLARLPSSSTTALVKIMSIHISANYVEDIISFFLTEV